MSSISQNAAPKLMKVRQRHSRWFALAVIPLIIFSIGFVDDDGFVHGLMDWSGYFLVILCVLGRAYSSAFIGGIKNEVVMREGPFSVVRNPLYVFSFIGLVGIGLQSGMFTVLALLILSFMFYYRQVVKREEEFLLHKFGEPYRQYKQDVPRWIPNLSLWREPEEIVMRPHFLRQTMMDAVVFFLPLPIFEMLEILRAHGVMPMLMLLP